MTDGPAAPRGPTTPRGVQLEPDLTTWQIWWGFNKDRFLQLEEAVRADVVTTGSDEFFMGQGQEADARDAWAPSESDLVDVVLPALQSALDRTGQRDIVSSCLVAMAKIGEDNPARGISILESMRQRLTDGDQEVRETAALAMGISRQSAAIPMLADLATDTPKGRALVGSPTGVDDRTRSFACYGLGLIAYGADDARVKRRCFEALRTALHDTSAHGIRDRNVPVAAINGMRLLNLHPRGSYEDTKLLDETSKTLWDFYGRDLGESEQVVQAHVAPALAHLLRRGGDRFGWILDPLVSDLKRSRSREIQQSAVLAIGLLAQPMEKDPTQEKYSAALSDYYRDGQDVQARHFAAIALGEIGGDRNRSALLVALANGTKAIEKPWAALGLGVLAFEARRSGADPDATIGRALHHELLVNKTPETVAAIAIALGLAGWTEAADDMERLLLEQSHQDELAGALCEGLALMGARDKEPTIAELLRDSVRRPVRLREAAIALGKLGDKTAAEQLQGMLSDGAPTVAKLSAVASALGTIGDRRSIAPLIALLQDESTTALSRAFAAVALGAIADAELLPWNAKIGADMNYRAAVETLTNEQSGVLDIL